MKWWDDPDLVAVKERIERQRASEATSSGVALEEAAARRVTPRSQRRGVREVRGVARLGLLGPEAVPGAEQRRADRKPPAPAERRRPSRRPIERLGPRPDLIAAWAVVLGVVLLIVAIVTAHG